MGPGQRGRRVWWQLVAALSLGVLGLPGSHTQACPAMTDLLQSHGTYGIRRDFNPPVELVDGCTYNVFIEKQTEVYLKLKRPTNTSRLVYEFHWQGTNQQPVTIFSWNGQCCSGPGRDGAGVVWPHIDFNNVAIYGDWADKPAMWKDILIFPFDDAGKDTYHCMPACQEYRPTPWYGDDTYLYITISTWLSYGSVEGLFSFTFEEPHEYIIPEQLAVLEEVYEECCWPMQKDMPWDWTWEFHQRNTSTDADAKPYCDWLAKSIRPYETRTKLNFTNQTCARLDNVFCDEDGNVVRLDIFESGLRCRLPASLSKLTGLKRVDLTTNRLEGTLPQALFSLPELTHVSLGHNSFTGTVPCLAARTKIEFMDVSKNFLTGTIPPCFSNARALVELDLSSNILTGTLPADLGGVETLVALTVSQNMLTGNFPESFASLTNLAFLLASRTYLGGVLSPTLLQKMKSLVKIDISHSSFEGTLPPFGQELSSLRIVQVQNNKFNGSVQPWFAHMQKVLLEGASNFAEGAELYLSGNQFSGKLPDELYDFIYDARYAVDHVDLSDNHLRCDMATGSWPSWALRLDATRSDLSHVIGRCTPVPVVTSVSPSSASEGDLLTIRGMNFAPSEEATCKISYADGFETTERLAFLDDQQAFCRVPEGVVNARGQSVRNRNISVTVANFGEDYYSAHTSQDYEEVRFNLVCANGTAGDKCQLTREKECSGHGDPTDDGSCLCDKEYSGKSCKNLNSGLAGWAVALIVLVLVIAVALSIFIACLIRAERKGEPVFSSHLTNPLLDGNFVHVAQQSSFNGFPPVVNTNTTSDESYEMGQVGL